MKDEGSEGISAAGGDQPDQQACRTRTPMAYSSISQKATYSSSLQPTRNPSEPRKILLTSPSGRGSWEAGGKDDSVDGSVVKGTSEISAHGCRCRSSTAA